MEENMKRVVDFAHQFILDYLNSNAVCIDFTMGHGYDTLFLSKHCPQGKVYAFDISKEAVDYTTQQLENANIKNVELIFDGHENFDHYIQNFKVGIFNFGFLPHSTTYQPTILNTSKTEVEKALNYLEVKGLLILEAPAQIHSGFN